MSEIIYDNVLGLISCAVAVVTTFMFWTNGDVSSGLLLHDLTLIALASFLMYLICIKSSDDARQATNHHFTHQQVGEPMAISRPSPELKVNVSDGQGHLGTGPAVMEGKTFQQDEPIKEDSSPPVPRLSRKECKIYRLFDLN